MRITFIEEIPGKGIAVITDERINVHNCHTWRIGESIAVRRSNGNRVTAQILGLELFRGPLDPPLTLLLGGINPGGVEIGAEILKVD